jgi:type I restriction enzyme S subunit
MSERRKMKISEFAEVIGGGTPSTKVEAYYGGTIPWLTPRDLTNYKFKRISKGERNITENGLKNSSAKLIPKNSILLTSRAPIGYLAIADNEICTNQGFKSLVANPDLADYNFVYYLLLSNIDLLKSFGTGTTFAEISGNVVKNIEFDLPDLPTQKAIAEILSSLDDKIELNNQINQNLETLAQVLFNQWFVDFEFPNENGEPYKSSGGEMVDSELGEVPKGWKVKFVREEISILNGYAFKSEDYVIEGIKIIRTKNFNESGFIELNDLVFLEANKSKDYEKFFLRPFDKLVVMVGASLGKSVVVTSDILPALQNQNIWNFRAVDKNYQGYFNFLVDKLIQLNIGSASGSAREFFRKDFFYDRKIIIPDLEVIHKFNEINYPTFEKISSNIAENGSLSNLRDTLLPKLISGELEVNESLLEPTF